MNGVALEFSRPGKPTDNAFIKSFNGNLREECVNASWFLSEKDAQSRCEAWRKEYNELRPHSSIGQQAPIELASASGQASLPEAEKPNFSHCPRSRDGVKFTLKGAANDTLSGCRNMCLYLFYKQSFHDPERERDFRPCLARDVFFVPVHHGNRPIGPQPVSRHNQSGWRTGQGPARRAGKRTRYGQRAKGTVAVDRPKHDTISFALF